MSKWCRPSNDAATAGHAARAARMLPPNIAPRSPEATAWFWERGQDPATHPARDRIYFHRCHECDSDQVRVLWSEFYVHSYSGDASYEYELICRSCGGLSMHAWAEDP